MLKQHLQNLYIDDTLVYKQGRNVKKVKYIDNDDLIMATVAYNGYSPFLIYFWFKCPIGHLLEMLPKADYSFG